MDQDGSDPSRPRPSDSICSPYRKTMDDTQLLEDLRSRFNAAEKLKYLFFWGHRQTRDGVTAACLSQWYEVPFIVDERRYLTAEHFMMAEKAALFGDEATRAKILKAPNPGAAKALGRQVANFNDDVWVANRFSIVVRGNQAKFGQNPALAGFLRRAAPLILVEASPVDRIWGIGLGVAGVRLESGLRIKATGNEEDDGEPDESGKNRPLETAPSLPRRVGGTMAVA